MTDSEDSNKDKAVHSAEVFADYHRARRSWIAQIAMDMDYYLNKQWTEKERSVLAARGQAPLVINNIFPTIQQKLAQLSMHRPVIRATPIEAGDQEKAEMWTLMIEYVLQQSGADLVEMEVKRNHLVQGVGYYYVHFDPYADDGKGEVRFASLAPELVYVDPASRRPDYSDADSIIVSQVYTMRQAKNMFPEMGPELERAKSQLSEYQDYQDTGLVSSEDPITPGLANQFPKTSDDDKVRIIERFSKIRVPFYILINAKEGAQETVDEEVYRRSYEDNPAWEATEVSRIRIERVVSAGMDTFLFSEMLPIEDYPIVPVPNIWVGTPYPIGDVRFMRGPQDQINKSNSLMILNQTSNSSPKWLVEEGSVNPTDWDAKSHIPGARLNYQAGFTPPREVFAQPIPSGLIHLQESAKQDIMKISGVYPVSEGNAAGAPETYGATLALEEFANRRAAASIEMLTHAKMVVGRTIIQYCQAKYTLPKYIRVVGSDETVKTALVNTGPTSQEHTRYDISIQSGKFLPTNRMAYAQHMLSLYEKGLIDNQAAIEALDIPNKGDLIKRVALQNQQAQTIQALKQELKDCEGQIQTLMRELQHAGVKSVVDESRTLEKDARNDHETAMQRIEGKAEVEVAKTALALKAVVDDAKVKAKEALIARTAKPKPGAGKTKKKE